MELIWEPIAIQPAWSRRSVTWNRVETLKHRISSILMAVRASIALHDREKHAPLSILNQVVFISKGGKIVGVPVGKYGMGKTKIWR
jgi:hypothetical protein